MTKERDPAIHKRLRRMLDPDVVERVAPGGSRGPLELIALRDEVQRRLQSTGGRPSDPNWDFTRQIPFTAEAWRVLEKLAESVSTEQRRVSAGQLAAMLIERAVGDLSDVS